MKDIAIYGAGGFGREAACLIKRINQVEEKWNLIGFFDDGKEIGSSNEYGTILGGINELCSWDKPLDIVFAIGSPKIVDKLSNSVINPNIDFPNVISPDVIIVDPDNFSMGKGNLVTYGCLFSCNTHVGDFNTFNSYITIGHDTVIGNYNSFMPAVKISGSVKIGNRNFFGLNSVVLQLLKIGNDTIVGASSIIIRKTHDGCTYIGNPAKKIEF